MYKSAKLLGHCAKAAEKVNSTLDMIMREVISRET